MLSFTYLVWKQPTLLKVHSAVHTCTSSAFHFDSHTKTLSVTFIVFWPDSQSPDRWPSSHSHCSSSPNHRQHILKILLLESMPSRWPRMGNVPHGSEMMRFDGNVPEHNAVTTAARYLYPATVYDQGCRRLLHRWNQQVTCFVGIELQGMTTNIERIWQWRSQSDAESPA